MPRNRALICLGSNIRPEENLRRVIDRLAAALDVVAVSSLYASPARGAPGSPPFLNAAVAVDTELEPHELKFDLLRALEAEFGRVRSADRNAPRPIDLDLVLFADRVIDDAEGGLEIPDPDIETSPHVALPLAEIAGPFHHPVLGTTLAEIAEPMRGADDIRRVAPPPQPSSGGHRSG